MSKTTDVTHGLRASRHYTVREQNGIDLLALHIEREAITQLIEVGTPLHTIFSLYPFDFEEYERSVIARLENNADFSLFSDNLHRAGGTLFNEAVKPARSLIHTNVAFGLLNADVDGKLAALTAALKERLYQQYLIGGSPERARELADTRAGDFTEFIYRSLAFAACSAQHADLDLDPALKQMISHVLIYLSDPEIYGRWGFKNRPGMRY